MGIENKWLCLDVLILAGKWDGIGKGSDNLHQLLLPSEHHFLQVMLTEKLYLQF